MAFLEVSLQKWRFPCDIARHFNRFPRRTPALRQVILLNLTTLVWNDYAKRMKQAKVTGITRRRAVIAFVTAAARGKYQCNGHVASG